MAHPDIKAVVFDIGGVLLDWDPRHLYRKLIADPHEMAVFLGGICTPRWHLAHDLGADTEQSCRELAAAHPTLAEEIMAWSHRSEEMIAGEIDEGVGLLAELKASGLKCLALSNMESDKFALRRSRYAFFRHFDGCVVSGIEGVAKPDQRIFEVLLSRYDLEPSATVFIDDTVANIAAARDLGLVAIHYSAGGELRRDLRRLGLPPGAAGSGLRSRRVTVVLCLPRSQQLIADLAVHVGAQPAAHLVEEPPAACAVVGRRGRLLVDVEPGHMLAEPGRLPAPVPAPRS